MANSLSLAGLQIDVRCLGDTMLLTDIKPQYAYIDNKRTDTVIGYKYTVVLPAKQFATLTVKVDGNKRMDIVTGQYLSVEFKNLMIKIYFDNNRKVQLTARADDIYSVDA